MIFVDTNYFIRAIEKDDRKQTRVVEELLLDGANGLFLLCSSTVVFFEIYWVIGKVYGRKGTDLKKILDNVLGLRFIIWKERELLEKSVEEMRKYNYDLEDAYNVEYSKNVGVSELASFDEKLQKLWKV